MTIEKTFHFITGLPRSGSTMLAAILRQNPDIMAGMTSPVGSMTAAMRAMMTQNREIESLLDDDVRVRMLRGIFDSYYAGFPDQNIVFDTNRAWSIRIPELLQIFDDFKMIAMVRNPAWVMDSVERMLQKNAIRPSSLAPAGSNLAQRVEAYMQNGGFIGGPMANLKEAMYGPHSSRLMIVEYEALCADPKVTLNAIYDFVGRDRFDHDFTDLDYKQERFDEALNSEGLHTVSGPVEQRTRKTLLPPEVFMALSSQVFWSGDISTNAARVVL
ncbi:sulfotransferase family protein [Halocynthiibacter sp.]|uniref:sulfotransferase family protein n=1 Tax=Halocynthiibacter sp. TaxID=1979210 RepID=UPI003C670337